MLSYKDIGKGIPILLIHGLGQNKEAWKPQHDLTNQYRLIMPDLRGHGSTEANEDITVANMAKDVIKLLDHLNIESVYICGLSLGGIVAQELYSQRPELVKGLILANTVSHIPLLAHYYINKTNNKEYDADVIIEHVASVSIHNQEYLEEAKKSFHIRNTYLESCGSAIGLNYYPLLLKINIPVLLIGSRQDKVTPMINAYMMSQFIRNVKLEIFDDCGHLSNLEQRVKFNECVDQFIKFI